MAIDTEDIKKLLKEYYFSDDDLKIILDYSDDFTVEQMKKDPDEFIHNMEKYFNLNKMSEALDACWDEENDDRLDEPEPNRLFEIILMGKGFSKKDIEALYEENLIPFNEDNDSIFEDCYYDSLKDYLD